MVNMRRLPGPKDPAELTYYAKLNGSPITGASAAKTLSSLDSQTMALTLGHFVQVQAERKRVLSQQYATRTASAVLVDLCPTFIVGGFKASAVILIHRQARLTFFVF